jgi:DNA polymerase III subunit epsilon
MRQIILDTETTGLNPKNGDRIVEIGCIELLNRRLTGNSLHFYINPERDIPEEAARIHGLRAEFLSDKPLFKDLAEEIIRFTKDAEVIIHNASFDMGFLDMEFRKAGYPLFSSMVSGVIDTLKDAQQMFPGKRNNLDALCQRFEVRNDHRTFHGALLDAELLAEVYLCMTRGQNDLGMDTNDHSEQNSSQMQFLTELPKNLKVIKADVNELSEHQEVLQDIQKKSKKEPVWQI